jgi:plasmid stabilization system protein ParE
MVKIGWNKLALDDLTEIEEFIAQDSVNYAIITVEKIYDRVSVLEKFPKKRSNCS